MVGRIFRERLLWSDRDDSCCLSWSLYLPRHLTCGQWQRFIPIEKMGTQVVRNVWVFSLLGVIVFLLIVFAGSAIGFVHQYERGVIFVLERLTGAMRAQPGCSFHSSFSLPVLTGVLL